MINVNFTGRLGADSELKASKNGNQFLSMRVATDDFVNGENVTHWINVTWFGDRAVKLQEFMKKGSLVNVMGNLRPSTYQTKSGESAVSLDVSADRVEFIRTSKQGEGQGEATAEATTARPKANEAEVAVATAAATTSDDDLPF